MNIFYLDDDLAKCATYHVDRHCVKMILEYAQLLSTACRFHGLDQGYKSTHINHPCSIWARNKAANWLWLRHLAMELGKEYKFRFNRNRDHASIGVIESLTCPLDEDDGCIDPLPQAMPDECKIPGDSLRAYRKYYMTKMHLHKWTKRPTPEWTREYQKEIVYAIPIRG